MPKPAALLENTPPSLFFTHFNCIKSTKVCKVSHSFYLFLHFPHSKKLFFIYFSFFLNSHIKLIKIVWFFIVLKRCSFSLYRNTQLKLTCSKSTIERHEISSFWYSTSFSSVSINDFEQVNVSLVIDEFLILPFSFIYWWGGTTVTIRTENKWCMFAFFTINAPKILFRGRKYRLRKCFVKLFY